MTSKASEIDSGAFSYLGPTSEPSKEQDAPEGKSGEIPPMRAIQFSEGGTDSSLDCQHPVRETYFDREPWHVLTAEQIRTARYDRRPWDGKLHDETRLEIACKVLRSIATEQPGANSCVKALCAAALEVIS